MPSPYDPDTREGDVYERDGTKYTMLGGQEVELTELSVSMPSREYCEHDAWFNNGKTPDNAPEYWCQECLDDHTCAWCKTCQAWVGHDHDVYARQPVPNDA